MSSRSRSGSESSQSSGSRLRKPTQPSGKRLVIADAVEVLPVREDMQVQDLILLAMNALQSVLPKEALHCNGTPCFERMIVTHAFSSNYCTNFLVVVRRTGRVYNLSEMNSIVHALIKALKEDLMKVADASSSGLSVSTRSDASKTTLYRKLKFFRYTEDI